MRTARTTPFDFYPGAVVNPFKVREPDLMMQLYKMRLKIAAGARFLITQVGFNLRKLVELKQYMEREGLGRVPVLANVYVPTPAVARMMRSGELAGCVVSDGFVERTAGEKKPQRLERAALMVAAAKDLGFAGAHIGGFGLTHRDFLTILERAAAIGPAWRGKMDELVFPYPGEFYLLPQGADGLSDAVGTYQTGRAAGAILASAARVAGRAPPPHRPGHIRRPIPRSAPPLGRPGQEVLVQACWAPRRSTARRRSAARAAAIAFRTTWPTPAARCAGATRSCATAPAAARAWTEPARRAPSCPACGTWCTRLRWRSAKIRSASRTC